MILRQEINDAPEWVALLLEFIVVSVASVRNLTTDATKCHASYIDSRSLKAELPGMLEAASAVASNTG